ncbi:uncharacterized protein LOC110608888 [Manihot esculenta]|uniref:uncharacterized protein LOC110608888 n=1 Tax=Manihot esculenta TaxID=3983 RepID=UPI000B5D3D23|nr:uncharacterized protein LOC110608888 [Manihot esculenta]
MENWQWREGVSCYGSLVTKEDFFYADDETIFIDPHMNVCDLLEDNGRKWNIALLLDLFSIKDIRAIITIPISLNSREDTLMWYFDKKGLYTVKSAYRVYLDMGRHHADLGGDLWGRLWKASAPPKVKEFCWRAYRNILPTEDNLRHRGVDIDTRCLWCHRNENVDHVLLHCSLAKEVLMSQNKDFKALAMTYAWKIWTSRNNLLCNQMISSVSRERGVYTSHTSFDPDYAFLQVHSAATSLGHFAWLCQVDGALFQAQDFAGYGFMVKNSEGIFQQAVFGFSEGGSSPALVAALALRRCLLYATEYLPFNGCILLDSLHVV